MFNRLLIARSIDWFNYRHFSYCLSSEEFLARVNFTVGLTLSPYPWANDFIPNTSKTIQFFFRNRILKEIVVAEIFHNLTSIWATICRRIFLVKTVLRKYLSQTISSDLVWILLAVFFVYLKPNSWPTRSFVSHRYRMS